MAKEEILFKLSMLEQQANEIKQQIEAVDSQIIELENLRLSLERIENKKNGEMLAPLGRGIFLKTEIKDNKILVNVGSKILVKKSFSETKEIIGNQIEEMKKLKSNLIISIEEINHNLIHLIQEAKESE